MAGFAIRSRFAGHPSCSAKTRNALRLKPDHPIGAGHVSPFEIEGWVEDARCGMETSLRANPLDIREQYEKQLKDLQEAYDEAMLELRAR